jgi:hypothetical protein
MRRYDFFSSSITNTSGFWPPFSDGTQIDFHSSIWSPLWGPKRLTKNVLAWGERKEIPIPKGGMDSKRWKRLRELFDEQAAMVIIHEALHHAGLSEYPQDPDGMTSRAINGMVMEQCGL